MQSVRKEVPFGGYTLSLETGEIARQAYSVIATAGETVVLAAVTARKTVKPGQDFFPLTVDIVERTYAAGRVPGGFFKRETRPSEKAVLNARLTDRVLRPMFPNGFLNEVQVVITVLSVDPEIDPDIPGLVAACAALSLSGIPFKGPVAAARVGYVDDKFLLNPTAAQQIDSQLDLVVGANRGGVVMVESEANILPEAVMLDAVLFAHEGMSPLFDTIDAFVAEVGEPAWEWQAPAVDQTLADALEQATLAALGDAYGIMEKQARVERISELRRQAMADFGGAEGERKDEVDQLFKKLEKRIVRGRVLAGNPRIDGRTTRDVRPVYIRNGLLPRAHGSALFTRGETQALVVSTLGTGRDAQIVENLIGGRVDETFMLHYNFPPYSVGETGRMGPTKRRELGHGKLAKRALNAVIPSQEEFPYVLRLVSEITESNGSSSMASVCGGSLALMDAGVPIKAPVAGVAMGLIKEDDRFAVLTDILGDEDHLGDMDFKVAGTSEGVTALQMDIKVDGLSRDIMAAALEQANEARMHILAVMNGVLNQPREEMSDYAPRILTIQINPEKIRDVIGKGGATIRSLTETTGATIDIDDDGTIRIASADLAAASKAQKLIEEITAEVEVGRIYEGKVVRLMDFGAFVSILPGRDGLVHISQISEERVERVADKLSEGEEVKVKVLEVDRQGRIRLSMKAVTDAGDSGASDSEVSAEAVEPQSGE